MPPNVDDPGHKKLEDDVKEGFKKIGWETRSLTYHDHCDIARDISRNQSMTAWLIRTRSDQFSMNESKMILWDAKTSTRPTGGDFAIETMPFLSALSQSLLGAKILFFCRRSDGQEYVASSDSLIPCASHAMLESSDPKRLKEMEVWHKEQFSRFKINCEIRTWTNSGSGSGDPFIAFRPDVFTFQTVKEFFGLLRMTKINEQSRLGEN